MKIVNFNFAKLRKVIAKSNTAFVLQHFFFNVRSSHLQFVFFAGSDTQVREKQDQFIFIGSEKITGNVDLLHLLESSHSVLIYERRYSNLKLTDSLSKMYLQPDVMVDERTCIHLQHLDSVVDERECEELRDTVLSLSLKCQKCFIILLAHKSR